MYVLFSPPPKKERNEQKREYSSSILMLSTRSTTTYSVKTTDQNNCSISFCLLLSFSLCLLKKNKNKNLNDIYHHIFFPFQNCVCHCIFIFPFVRSFFFLASFLFHFPVFIQMLIRQKEEEQQN